MEYDWDDVVSSLKTFMLQSGTFFLKLYCENGLLINVKILKTILLKYMHIGVYISKTKS